MSSFEVNLAENEMIGLMAARKEYGITAPFKDMNISGSLHTPQAFSDQGEHVQRFSCGDMCV